MCDRRLEVGPGLAAVDDIFIGHLHHGADQFKVFRRQCDARLRDGLAQQFAGAPVLAAVEVGLSDRAPYLQCELGFTLKFAIDSAFGRGQQRDVGFPGMAARHRIGLLDDRQHEVLDQGGAPCLVAGHIGLPQRDAQTDSQCNDDRTTSRQRQRVALDELAQAIGAAVGLSAHRQAGQIVVDVVGESSRTLIALTRVALERGQDDGVDISAQSLGSRLLGGGVARLAQATPQHFGFKGTRFGRVIEPLPADQFEHHDTERIDIGRHRDRQAHHLLGRRVRQRQGTTREPCQRGLVHRRRIAFDQLGDAEVEQFGCAVCCHQHIAWLQIAMNDQLSMRVRHGPDDLYI